VSKILSLKQAVSLTKDFKLKGKKVCHCHGCFDLVHFGHLKYFEASKAFGDILIVSITPDRFIKKGPGRPAFDEKKRLNFLAELEVVDYVFLNNEADAVSLLKLLKPNFTFRGKEYEDFKKDITGKIALEAEAIESVGGSLKIIDEERFSSTNLLNNGSFNFLKPEQEKFINLIRKKEIPQKTLSFLESVSNKKVLNIGEIIIDEYIYTSVRGTVTKHPIISASFLGEKIMTGGVLATVRHLDSMINNTFLLTTYGEANKNYLPLIKDSIPPKTKSKIFENKKDFTVVKRRFISSSGYPNPLSDKLDSQLTGNSQNRLFEIGYIPSNFIDRSSEKKLLKFLDEKLSEFDLAIVSDFGHGLMTSKVINKIAKSKKLSINAQTNSTNFGFNLFNKYSKSNFICLDELEARLPFGERIASLDAIAKRILKKYARASLMISRGKNGLVFYQDGKVYRAPALASKVIDPVGAGDALYMGASLAAIFQKDPLVTVLLSSIMGMLGTSIEGNERGISRNEIIRSIKGLI
tara:strand:- start:10490 stop:12055 length:1566 start_codon:yes stop_codon:yes gene_type:complete